MATCRDEPEDQPGPPQNGGDGGNVDDESWLRLIQLLRSDLARLPPLRGGVPAVDQNLKFTLSLLFVYIINERFIHCLHVVCTLFTLSYNAMRFHLLPGA